MPPRGACVFLFEGMKLLDGFGGLRRHIRNGGRRGSELRVFANFALERIDDLFPLLGIHVGR